VRLYRLLPKLRRRSATIALAAIFLAAALGACDEVTPGPTPQPSAAPAQAPTPPGGYPAPAGAPAQPGYPAPTTTP
jgi:hypothetical protein